MTDPAEAADNFLEWWQSEKFKVGYFLGFLSAILLVWMAS